MGWKNDNNHIISICTHFCLPLNNYSLSLTIRLILRWKYNNNHIYRLSLYNFLVSLMMYPLSSPHATDTSSCLGSSCLSDVSEILLAAVLAHHLRLEGPMIGALLTYYFVNDGLYTVRWYKIQKLTWWYDAITTRRNCMILFWIAAWIISSIEKSICFNYGNIKIWVWQLSINMFWLCILWIKPISVA